METLTPDMITQIYSSTSLGVSIMLAAAGLGSALGWGCNHSSGMPHGYVIMSELIFDKFR